MLLSQTKNYLLFSSVKFSFAWYLLSLKKTQKEIVTPNEWKNIKNKYIKIAYYYLIYWICESVKDSRVPHIDVMYNTTHNISFRLHFTINEHRKNFVTLRMIWLDWLWYCVYWISLLLLSWCQCMKLLVLTSFNVVCLQFRCSCICLLVVVVFFS